MSLNLEKTVKDWIDADPAGDGVQRCAGHHADPDAGAHPDADADTDTATDRAGEELAATGGAPF